MNAKEKTVIIRSSINMLFNIQNQIYELGCLESTDEMAELICGLKDEFARRFGHEISYHDIEDIYKL